MIVDLPSGQIIAGLQNSQDGQNFFLLSDPNPQIDQFTFSIPGVGADWSGYPSNEPLEAGYSVLTTGQADAFRQALDLWDELIPQDFSEIIENASVEVPFGEVRVAFTTISDGGTAGYAYSGPPQLPGGRVGDVWLNSSDAGEDFSQGTSNFETFLHEIGHTLGTKHPFTSPFLDNDGIDPNYDSTTFTIMSYTRPSGFVVTFTGDSTSIGSSSDTAGTGVATTPMVLDILFAQTIYGVETTTRAGNDTYVFNETDLSISTIFDSGGNDTIDLSSGSRKNIIDLRPGAYSSIGFFPEEDQRAFWKMQFDKPFQQQFIDDVYNGTSPIYENVNNLGIAFSTVIENAFGGSNADDILGNDAGNVLRGNAGDDTLQGGMGDDTINGGADTDIAVFSGNRGDYFAEVEGGGFRLTDMRLGNHDGSDITEEIETYRFADGDVTAANLIGANQAPIANNDTVAASGEIEFDPTINDSDPDGDPLTITALGLEVVPTNGTAAITGSNMVRYIPNNGFTGQDSFSYQVRDDNGGFASATVTVNVSDSNDPPTANSDTTSTDEDTPVTVSVLANDTDPNADNLTVTGAGNAVNGTLSAIGPSAVTFTPDADFNGIGSFTYTIEDGNGGTDTGTVTVTVNPVNDAPPSAVDDSISVNEDGTVTIDAFANDSDLDGDSLTLDGHTQAANGFVTSDNIGNFTYRPNENFNGSDSFRYFISDGNGGDASATVFITVNAVNENPVAIGDTASVDEDASVAINVLANDSDVDGDMLIVTSNSQAANGTITDNGSGNFTYAPHANFSGSDSFAYTISDGQGGSAAATVSITIGAVNDDPVAIDDIAVTGVDAALDIAASALLANDSDIDGDTLTIISAGGGVNGTASLSGSTVTFTPDAGFTGAASFSYTVSDGNGGSASANVAVTVSDSILPIDGSVADGYLAGANVFVDLNGNGVLDALEDSTRTDAMGQFSLVTAQSGPLVATGGIDVDTGLLNRLTLSAPQGSTVINPLTTLIQLLVAGGSDAAAAEAAVEAAFGLDASLTFTQTDLIAASATSPAAFAAQKAAASVYELIDAVSDAGGNTAAAFAALAAQVSAGGTVDLTSQSLIQAVVSAGLAGDVSQLVADTSATNLAIAAAQTLDAIANVQDDETPPQNFSLFVADGFAGAIGGSGTVFGTSGFQDITIDNAPGTVVLDASFNRGGDIVRLSGNADQWFIALSGSSAKLSDGDTIVAIPLGPTGLVLSFDDGERTLLFDNGSFTIGGQAFDGSFVAITAADDGSSLPTGADPSAKGVLFLAADGEVSVSGQVGVFGASGHEMVSLLSGNLTLDPSFNNGGDTIAFDVPASAFLASQNGSALFLDSADTDALIPVGPSGATLSFAGGDDRIVLLDTGIPGITVDGQLITFDPVLLMAAI